MGFRTGSFTVTFFYIEDPITEDFWRYVDEHLKIGAFRPYNEDEARSFGFVTWDDLFNFHFDGGSYRKGEYIAVQFRIDEKKIPSMILKQHLQEEKKRYAAERGRYPTRSEERFIKEAVERKLLKLIMACPKGCEVVWNPMTHELILATSSPTLIEAFVGHFEKTFRVFPVPLYHLKWALALPDVSPIIKDKLTQMVNPSSPSIFQEGMFLGYEFLTWLWYRTDTGRSVIKLEDERAGNIYLGDRLALSFPLEGGERVVCTTKTHRLDEARTAISKGKKLEEAQWLLQVEDREYSFTIDTSLWTIKSLKPSRSQPTRGEDADTVFFDRIFFTEEVRLFIGKLYSEFLNLRFTSIWQDDILAAMDQWVQSFKNTTPSDRT